MIKYIKIPIRRGTAFASVDTITAFQIDLPYSALNTSGWSLAKHSTTQLMGIEEPTLATDLFKDIEIHNDAFNFAHIPIRFEDGVQVAYYYSRDTKSRIEFYCFPAVYSILGGRDGTNCRAWIRREDLGKTWSCSRRWAFPSDAWGVAPRIYLAVSSDGVLFLMAFGRQMIGDDNPTTTEWVVMSEDVNTVAWGIYPENGADIEKMKLEYYFDGVEVEETTRYDDTDVNTGEIKRDNTSDIIGTPLIPDVDPNAFVNVYKLSALQLKAFKTELFSTSIADIVKRWWDKTTDCIVALNIAPLELEHVTRSAQIKVGTHTMEAGAKQADGVLFKVNCGTVEVRPYYENFADYEATVVQCYIPFIGFIPLKTIDVMGATLTLEYIVNIVTGDFNVFLKVARNKFDVNLNAVLYESSGKMFSQIPVTSSDYSSVLQGAINTMTSTASTVASATTGNVSGMIAGGSSIASSVLGSAPAIQRSGSFGNNASICAMRRPFVLIERPRIAIPSSLQDDKGFMANFSATLGSLEGYTEVRHVNLDGIDLTASEKTRLESILKNGFYI